MGLLLPHLHEMEAEYTAIPLDKNHLKWRFFLRQLFVCFTPTVFFLMIGLSLGAPTVAVPQLRREANSTSAVSEDMASWITSIVPYSSAVWIICIIIATHHVGRKKVMIAVTLNTLIAFSVLYFSKNVEYLFISQLLQGPTQATHSTTCFLVVLEYTSPTYRGGFVGIFSATYFWGMWVANAVGMFFDFRYIGLIGIGGSIYNLVALYFIPESPYWLACNSRYDACAAVHRWLKGVGDDAEKELDAMIKSQRDSKNKKGKRKLSFIDKYTNALKDPQIYKPVLLNFVLISIYQFCGKIVCAVYAVEIMKKITETETEAYIGVLILDGFSVVGMYMGSLLARHLRRRTLLIGASIICAMILFILSAYLYLVEWAIVSENSYISVILLAGFSLAACCGPIIVGGALFAEMYPTRYRSFAMCIMCISAKACLGSLLKIGPFIFKTFYIRGTFLFFAITFSVSLLLVYRYVPETKDKTIQEISEMFRKKKTGTKDSEIMRDTTG